MSREAMERALTLLRDGVISIDAEGRVWRHAMIVRGVQKAVTPRRAENEGHKGYLRLTMHIPGAGLSQIMAHRLVWEAANGPIPCELQINHKDLNKQNNRLSNMELTTGAENIRHSYANGRPAPWSKIDRKTATWREKPMVSPETAALIREARASGVIYREIAERFGVSITHAHRLCAQESHVIKQSKGGGNGPRR